MKKKLLALAVLGVCAGAASAQSNVTIYGSIDGGVRYLTHSSTAGTKISEGSNGTYSSNRLGFKGTEELGGGLNAHFILESGFNGGTGALNNTNNQLFERTASVGLGGAWGSVDVGRQMGVSFKTISAFDPFRVKYLAVNPAQMAVDGSQGLTATPLGFGNTRFNNDIEYTGNFGPVTAYAEYALGEVAGDSTAGRVAAAGAIYVNGPLSFGGSYTTRKTDPTQVVNGRTFPVAPGVAPLPTYNPNQTNNQWMVGAAYTIDAVRLTAGYVEEKQDWLGARNNQVRSTYAWGGVNYTLSPTIELTGSYSQIKGDQFLGKGKPDGTKNVLMLGATYSLSKRTLLYVEADNSQFKDGAVAATGTMAGIDKQTGFSTGINHSF